MEASLKTNFYSAITRDEVGFDSIPLDISEIMQICKEYSSLGFKIQSQIDYILENGIEEAIKNNKISDIEYIKDFFEKMSKMYYLGDAALQAEDCLKELDKIKSNIKIMN